MIDLRECPYLKAKRYIKNGYSQRNMDLIWHALSLIDHNYFVIRDKTNQKTIEILKNICQSHIVYNDYIGQQYIAKQQRREARKMFNKRNSWPRNKQRILKIHSIFGIYTSLEQKKELES